MKDKRTNVIRWNYYRQLQSNYRHNKHIIRYKEKLLFFLIRFEKLKSIKRKISIFVMQISNDYIHIY